MPGYLPSVAATLALMVAVAQCAPDVNQLPTRDFDPGSYGRSAGGCSKLAGQSGQCVEKIARMEYRPLISIIEQRYKVPVPEITYIDVIDPEEQPYTVLMPKPFTTKVPVTHIKEHPEVRRLTKIKEIVEKVPVDSTDVIRIPKRIPEPRITEETVSIPDIRKDKQTKVIKRYRKAPAKKVTIDQFKEETRVRRIRRPILEIRPRYVNVTRVEYINRVVEVPKIVYKKLRLPRPLIQPGETIYAETSNVEVKTSDYDEETPEYYDEVIEADEVVREPKTIKIPYKESTRVVRPVIFEAPIQMPQEEPVDIERHVRVAGPQSEVPCGVMTEENRYLPAKCPACSGDGNCPTCPPCSMGGYQYSSPSVPFTIQ